MDNLFPALFRVVGGDLAGLFHAFAGRLARDGQGRPLVATLKADGMKLMGTVNGMNGQPDIPIMNGMAHGDEVMWSSKRPAPNGGTMQFDYKGKVSGDEMQITIVRADGQGAPMACTAKRSN